MVMNSAFQSFGTDKLHQQPTLCPDPARAAAAHSSASWESFDANCAIPNLHRITGSSRLEKTSKMIESN